MFHLFLIMLNCRPPLHLFLHSVAASGVVGSCCSLKESSGGRKGEGVLRPSAKERATEWGGKGDRADQVDSLSYNLTLLGRCLLLHRRQKKLKCMPIRMLSDFYVPSVPKEEIVCRFQRGGVEPECRGISEVVKTSFSSGVADSSMPAVSAISWCLICELLLYMPCWWLFQAHN